MSKFKLIIITAMLVALAVILYQQNPKNSIDKDNQQKVSGFQKFTSLPRINRVDPNADSALNQVPTEEPQIKNPPNEKATFQTNAPANVEIQSPRAMQHRRFAPDKSTQLKGYVPLEGSLEDLGRKACEKSPSGWYVAGESSEDYLIGFEAENGEPAAFIKSKVPAPRPHAELNHCGNIDLTPNKIVQVTAMVKGVNISDYANFHVRVTNQYHEWVADKKLSFKDSFDWRPISLEVEVPEGAEYVVYGVTFESTGEVWIKQVTFVLKNVEPNASDG